MKLLVVAFVCMVMAMMLLVNPVVAQFEDDSDLEVHEEHEMFGENAHQQQQQQQQQQITLTREILDALMQRLSVDCRSELESAMANSGDVSMDCKMEIQESLIALNVAPGQQPPPKEKESRQRRNPNGEKMPSEPQDNGRSQQALLAIGGLVLALVGIPIVAILLRSKSSSSNGDNKPQKKLSKKKEEKLRMKQNSR